MTFLKGQRSLKKVFQTSPVDRRWAVGVFQTPKRPRTIWCLMCGLLLKLAHDFMSKHIYIYISVKSKTIYIYIYTLGIQSPCQRMTGVYDHLLSKEFRFHYHSQKVIGSLGISQSISKWDPPRAQKTHPQSPFLP